MSEVQSDLRQVHRSCPQTTTLSDRRQIRLRRERQAHGRRATARDGLERRATAPGGGLYSEPKPRSRSASPVAAPFLRCAIGLRVLAAGVERR